MKMIKRLVLVLAVLGLAIGFQPLPTMATTTNLTQMLQGSVASTGSQNLLLPVTSDAGAASLTTSAWFRQVAPLSGTLSYFRVEQTSAPAGGATKVYTLQVNEVDTALVVTITAGQTTGSNTGTTLNITAGDRIRIKASYTSSNSGGSTSWSLIFEGQTTTDSMYLGCGYAATSAARYTSVTNGMWNGATNNADNNMANVVPIAGTFKKFYVHAYSAGAATGAVDFLVNGVSKASIALTFSGNYASGNDTATNIAVSAGDLICIKLSAPSATYFGWGIGFSSGLDQQSLVMGFSNGSPSTAASNYQPLLQGQGNAWSATADSSGAQDPGYAGWTISNLYVSNVTSPGASKSYDYTIMCSGGSTGITVNLTGSSLTGQDNAHSWNLTGVTYFENLQIQATPTNTPTAPTFVRWGLAVIIYKIPQITSQATTTIKDTYATFNANITLLINGNATVRGFIFSTSSHAGYSGYEGDIHETGSYGTGTFSLIPVTLVKNTTYYFRAYATDSVGTGYGSELNFTTLNPQGTATSLGMAIIGGTTASGTYDSGISVYSVNNIGTCAINVTVQGFDATGGLSWTLTDDGSVGTNTYGMYAGTSTYNVIVRKTAPFNAVITNLAPGGSATFGVEVKTPSVMADQVTKNTSIAVLYVAY